MYRGYYGGNNFNNDNDENNLFTTIHGSFKDYIIDPSTYRNAIEKGVDEESFIEQLMEKFEKLFYDRINSELSNTTQFKMEHSEMINHFIEIGVNTFNMWKKYYEHRKLLEEAKVQLEKNQFDPRW